jgi:DNA-binding PadR family transcriptional regulator
LADWGKRPDIGEGPIKECILGILSSHPDGCSANRILRDLPRTQSPDQLKTFLKDLEDRELIKKEDLSHFRQNLEGYKITEKGKKHLENYFKRGTRR